tara:strand:+ start:943 stop:1083 length:141 start_codon:yes stop_codon:yes gene_type:complete
MSNGKVSFMLDGERVVSMPLKEYHEMVSELMKLRVRVKQLEAGLNE